MSIKIKKIFQDDWQKYRDIRLEALKNEPDAYGSSYEVEIEKDQEAWKNRLGGDNKFFYVGHIDDVFVAIGGAFKDDNNEWNIIAIYVKSEFRGRGIGAMLISKILTEAKERNIKKIFLTVNTNRTAAVSLYKKIGFKIIDTKKNQLLGDGKYYDEFEMVKNLIGSKPHITKESTKILREAINDAKKSNKSFKTGATLIKAALKD